MGDENVSIRGDFDMKAPVRSQTVDSDAVFPTFEVGL